jgi:hypothetical protein
MQTRLSIAAIKAAAKECAMGQTPLTRRIWYGYPYVIPADVLSAEPTHDEDASSLRAEASHDGTCYLRLLKSFHDGTYLARVAAHPAFFPAREGYTVVLTEAQLAQACPWDSRSQVA